MIPVVLVILAILGAAGLFVYLNNGSLLKEKQLQLPSLAKNEIVIEKDFATGLRLAALGKYDEAVANFEKLNFNKLTDSDKEIVLHAYLKADQAQRALDLEPSFDETIINEYLKNGQLEKLRELKTNSKNIAFEIAVLDNDYEKIIDLKDEVKKDARRASAIANAYYQLGLKEEAVQFTSLAVFDGINMWENDNQSHVSKEGSSHAKTQSKDNSGSFVLIVLLLIGMGLGAVLFFIGQKTKKVVQAKLSERRELKKQKQKEKLNERNENENKVSETKEEEKTEEKDEKYSYYYEEDEN